VSVCPVCGKGEIAKGMTVSHLTCVEKVWKNWEGQKAATDAMQLDRARIAELEADNLQWQDESLRNLIRAGEAEAELAALRRSMKDIMEDAGAKSAELAALRAEYDACQKTCLQRDALIDELDEMKARRCETCRYWTRYTDNRGECEVSVKVDNINPACTFGCVGWQAREDGES
jgi:hypothetical protein